MKKQFLLGLLAVFYLSAVTSTFAQNSISNRGCGTMEYKAWEEKNDPSIKALREKLDQEAKVFIENQKKNPIPQAVITIPVVFHIVYNAAGQNVSDACIMAQLKVINDDYRKKNADWTKVTQTGWNALVADCEVEFCLAVRDPSNNATTGITRTSTTHAAFSTNNDVKYTSKGGKDVWDRNKYFNIWVCDLSSSLLGYAQFPGGPAATDGLVIDYQYMIGAQGCGTAPYNLGRTATHELGHCFNFRHIWGDESACAQDDGVNDTPKQEKEHYGTFTAGSVQTDACSAASPGTMWMNYMDYTDDGAMYMFTEGQKAVMTATMNGPRASLKTSNGCSPLTAVEYLLSSESVSVFPNPSYGNVMLKVNIPNLSAADVAVYNSLGDVVLKKKLTDLDFNNEVKLDMNSQLNGMYFLKLETTDGSVTKKIILNR